MWAAFDQSLSYSGEVIESCHNQAFLTPCPPFSYIFCTWGKNAPRNAWKQIFIKFWAIMDHSVPSQTEEGSTGDEDFDRWVEFLRTFSRARLCCFVCCRVTLILTSHDVIGISSNIQRSLGGQRITLLIPTLLKVYYCSGYLML